MSIKYALCYGRLKGSIQGILDQLLPDKRLKNPNWVREHLEKTIEECDKYLKEHANDKY